ncbi:hypothetical protein KY290_016697 [Solanum tuberosum]|uniref:Uncharacterized protein n=1 Tax=Solanum tuberosum TaxID=4113 RepID=A0ABQ7V961_SOLTU|nr:hypothetical protein KY284_015979 [Solanum tuberosum]KAH0760624.1 hypothetical protein KY290_016697 [Solanum tuberosum]
MGSPIRKTMQQTIGRQIKNSTARATIQKEEEEERFTSHPIHSILNPAAPIFVPRCVKSIRLGQGFSDYWKPSPLKKWTQIMADIVEDCNNSDIRSDTLKKDQFGAWIKAENRLASADYQRYEGVHSTEGHNLMKNKNSKLIEEKRDVGTRKILIHIQGVDSTNTQMGIKKDNAHILCQNECIETAGLKETDEDSLHIRESNQLQPMEIEPYESEGGPSVANKTQILDIDMGEEDKGSKLPLDNNTYDATAKENEDAA